MAILDGVNKLLKDRVFRTPNGYISSDSWMPAKRSIYRKLGKDTDWNDIRVKDWEVQGPFIEGRINNPNPDADPTFKGYQAWGTIDISPWVKSLNTKK